MPCAMRLGLVRHGRSTKRAQAAAVAGATNDASQLEDKFLAKNLPQLHSQPAEPRWDVQWGHLPSQCTQLPQVQRTTMCAICLDVHSTAALRA